MTVTIAPKSQQKIIRNFIEKDGRVVNKKEALASKSRINMVPRRIGGKGKQGKA